MSLPTFIDSQPVFSAKEDALRELEQSGFDPRQVPSIGRDETSARARVSLRTRELALLAGRRSFDITQSDYERAKREVTGETLPAKQDAILDVAG